MTAGRPTEYNYADLKPKIEAYLESCVDTIEEFHKTRGEKSDTFDRIINVKIPTVEGLAIALNINKTTVYEWKAIHEEFSNDIDRLLEKQTEALIKNGLSGAYNPTIAKVLLSKRGYKEGTENELNVGGTSTPVLVKFIDGKDN